jgi:hypothetical protein
MEEKLCEFCDTQYYEWWQGICENDIREKKTFAETAFHWIILFLVFSKRFSSAHTFHVVLLIVWS